MGRTSGGGCEMMGWIVVMARQASSLRKKRLPEFRVTTPSSLQNSGSHGDASQIFRNTSDRGNVWKLEIGEVILREASLMIVLSGKNGRKTKICAHNRALIQPLGWANKNAYLEFFMSWRSLPVQNYYESQKCQRNCPTLARYCDNSIRIQRPGDMAESFYMLSRA